jgi:UDP:flavonoid glycosyltransferase YjiC (YdhE family)
VSALVTNGGSGGMHYALANGVLLVVVGATEE